ncbi:hypothetical protein MZM54_03735 [[Brevibacterium] frigoritolerans]|nr:hypothetical protein [Peribacillus frigoritolerans]
MNTLDGNYTYKREDVAKYMKTAFQVAGFTKEQAVESIISSKETKYTLYDRIVRFLIFEPLNQFGGFLFQYNVFELTEEDKVVPKMYSSSKKVVKVEQIKIEPKVVKDPVFEDISTKEFMSPPTNEKLTVPLDQLSSFLEEECEELTGQALVDHLEANGQQALFL